MKLTLHKYIFHEIWPTFLTSLVVLAVVVVMAKMLTISEWVINQGVDPMQAVKLVFCLMPSIILFALPAACLLAVFIAFLRVSSDNEILALKSSGISLYQLLPTVLFVSFSAFLVAGLLGAFGSPWGNRSFKDLIFQIAQAKPDLGIKERIFCEPFEDVTFYVNSFSSKDRVMKDVFVSDMRDPLMKNTILAKEGRIVSHPKYRVITIGFHNGTIFMVHKNYEATRTINFKSYNLNIGLDDILHAFTSRKKSPKEMDISELIRELKTIPTGQRYNEILIELLEKISIPIAVFFMGIIGVPLGAQIRSRERSFAIGFSLGIFVVYYLCLVGVRSLCETGTVHPAIGIWLPDLFLGTSCFYLLKRVANEHPIDILGNIQWNWKF